VSEGRELGVVGSDADQTWWKVYFADDQFGWVSDTTVHVKGPSGEVPVTGPLMPDDLEATWAVYWECHAEGCAQEECLGDSRAKALQVRTVRWLEVTRKATWQEECGEPEDWLTQVDRYSGQERRVPSDPPLFYVWEGADPGPENRTIELLGGTLSLWCTDTRSGEVAQEDGWTILFEGSACYDRIQGVMVTMEYIKRWLFTGTYAGRTYEREYFGDYEVYRQILTSTNLRLGSE